MRKLIYLGLLLLFCSPAIGQDTLQINSAILNRIDSINVQQQELIPQVNQYIALEREKSSTIIIMLQSLGFEVKEGKVYKDGFEYGIAEGKIFRIKED